MDRLKRLKDKQGKLIHYAWPGGYPIIYFDGCESVLCPDCAQKSLDDPGEIENFTPVSGDIYLEGATIHCDQCGRGLDSAYGDINGQ